MIINEVNGFQNKPEYKEFEERFKKIDDGVWDKDTTHSMSYDEFMEQKKKGEEEIIKKLLRDNNISLN